MKVGQFVGLPTLTLELLEGLRLNLVWQLNFKNFSSDFRFDSSR